MTITINGLSLIHRIMLRHCIRTELAGAKTSPDSDIAIDVVQDIGWRRYSSLWYGGTVVKNGYKGWTFQILANGDVCADLYRKSDAETAILSVSDRHNAGRFGRKVKRYLCTDRALNDALCHRHSRYALIANSSNRWECFATDPHGCFHDLMWPLDSDHILQGIAEVLFFLDYTIQEFSTRITAA